MRLADRLRRLVLPWTAGLLLVYIMLHTPLRNAIARLFGLESRGCFLCLDSAELLRLSVVVAALILIFAAFLAAWATTGWFGGDTYERPLVFGVSMLAFAVIPAAWVGLISGWLGVPLLRPPVGPLLSALPALWVVGWAWSGGWRPVWKAPEIKIVPGLARWLAALAVILLSASVLIGLVHPATGGDGLSYHAPMAVFLWQDGDLTRFLDRAPGTWALANPGTAELWYGLLRLAGGEPLANLGQLPFALLGSAAVAAFARRLRLGRGAAQLAAFAYLLIPMVVVQSVQQPNDLVAAGLLMATICIACAPLQDWSGRRVALIGLGSGLVITAKLVLAPALLGVAVFLLAAVFWQARKRRLGRALVAQGTWIGLLFLLAAGPWWARNAARYGNPVFPAGIPFIGRGVFLNDFGTLDTSFVPSAAFWPVYPLLEPHDDRSGFGALVAVAVLPGMIYAARRRLWQPLGLFILPFAFMLPAWWLMTMHEPRFFLWLAGLSLAFIPFTLAAAPKARRGTVAGVFAVAAIFSALVTAEQSLLPAARMPVDRLEFYDQVWGVDPAVLSIPEREGVLNQTGFERSGSEYSAYYPLLGSSQSRLVLPVDREGTTEGIVERMRAAGIRYAYVTASPEWRSTVEATYSAEFFDLSHSSTIITGEAAGVRRHLFRPAAPGEEGEGIRRYLFILKCACSEGS